MARGAQRAATGAATEAGAPPARGGLSLAQRRRLQEIWRSAGWPCFDPLELELETCGWIQRHWDAEGRQTLRLSEAGLQALSRQHQRQRQAFDAHEHLVAEVARLMQREGRIVWQKLSLRVGLPADPDADATALPAGDGLLVHPPGLALGGDAPPPEPAAVARPGRRWVVAMPDVFSIRHTTREDCTEPVVHEIKVRRADLLADLRRQDKGAAYRAMASQCWYVLRDGIGQPDEVPPVYGVMVAGAQGLAVLRPAPRRAARLPFAVWMALARATPDPPPTEDPQAPLA